MEGLRKVSTLQSDIVNLRSFPGVTVNVDPFKSGLFGHYLPRTPQLLLTSES